VDLSEPFSVGQIVSFLVGCDEPYGSIIVNFSLKEFRVEWYSVVDKKDIAGS
jgi:hypothetical protein